MPVAGIMPGLLEIGKIKIGIKGEMVESAGGVKFRRPKKLDHFVITTNQRNEKGDYIEDTELMDALKASDKAKVDKNGNLIGIPIRLLYNDLDLIFPTRYVCYQGAHVSWYSNDGKTIHTRDGRTLDFNPKLVDPTYDGRDRGKINGVLSVVIDGAGTFGGCWKFRTTSINTVRSILGSLLAIKQVAGGRLAWLPLMLTVQPRSTVIPGSGAPTTVHVVSVIFPGNVQDLQHKAIEMARNDAQFLIEMKNMEEEAKKLIAEAEILSSDDTEIVEEFYPDEAAKAAGGETGPVETIEPEAEKEDTPKDEPAAAEEETPAAEEETPPAEKEKGGNGAADAWNAVNKRAAEMLMDHPQGETFDARDFTEWAAGKFDLSWLAEVDNDVFASAMARFMGEAPWGDGGEEVPPTAAGSNIPEPKNPDDPAAIENWIKLGTSFEGYVLQYIDAINAAPIKVRIKAQAKWRRLSSTSGKPCPIKTFSKDADPAPEAAPAPVETAVTEQEEPEAEAEAPAPAAEKKEEPQQQDENQPTADSEPPAAPVSDDNLVSIIKLKKSLAINDMTVWRKLIEPYNVDTAKAMTNEQAANFIAKLQEIKDNPALLPT